jgi:hypothetical protein
MAEIAGAIRMKKTPGKGSAGGLSAPGGTPQTSQLFVEAVGRALRRSARTARRIAHMHGTPVYIWRDGKVVAEKP